MGTHRNLIRYSRFGPSQIKDAVERTDSCLCQSRAQPLTFFRSFSRSNFVMSYRRLGRLAVALLALAFAAPSGLAQKSKKDQGQDPSEKPRNVKPELKKAYKDWLEKDVAYIITEEERKAFKKLETDEERERFIEEFWRRRDPDPDTDENEYREEYYERIAYANEHYASGIPGWKTDRGRIYITWGKPDEVETHPSGGAYNRESYAGGGSTTTYPFELR